MPEWRDVHPPVASIDDLVLDAEPVERCALAAKTFIGGLTAFEYEGARALARLLAPAASEQAKRANEDARKEAEAGDNEEYAWHCGRRDEMMKWALCVRYIAEMLEMDPSTFADVRKVVETARALKQAKEVKPQ